MSTYYRLVASTVERDGVQDVLALCQGLANRGATLYASVRLRNQAIGRPFKYATRKRRWFEPLEQADQTWLPFDEYQPAKLLSISYERDRNRYFLHLRQGSQGSVRCYYRVGGVNDGSNAIQAIEFYKEVDRNTPALPSNAIYRLFLQNLRVEFHRHDSYEMSINGDCVRDSNGEDIARIRSRSYSVQHLAWKFAVDLPTGEACVIYVSDEAASQYEGDRLGDGNPCVEVAQEPRPFRQRPAVTPYGRSLTNPERTEQPASTISSNTIPLLERLHAAEIMSQFRAELRSCLSAPASVRFVLDGTRIWTQFGSRVGVIDRIQRLPNGFLTVRIRVEASPLYYDIILEDNLSEEEAALERLSETSTWARFVDFLAEYLNLDTGCYLTRDNLLIRDRGNAIGCITDIAITTAWDSVEGIRVRVAFAETYENFHIPIREVPRVSPAVQH